MNGLYSVGGTDFFSQQGGNSSKYCIFSGGYCKSTLGRKKNGYNGYNESGFNELFVFSHYLVTESFTTKMN